MSHSSQAGLASIRRSAGPEWHNRPTLVAVLNSATFELRLSTDGHWYVIHAQSPNANAQTMVGQGFQVGRNPYEHDRGYAAEIQRHLNQME